MSYDPSVYNPNSDPDNVMWEETECADCGASVTVSVDDTDEPLCYACAETLYNLQLRRPRATEADLNDLLVCVEMPTVHADHFDAHAAAFDAADPLAAVLRAAARAARA